MPEIPATSSQPGARRLRRSWAARRPWLRAFITRAAIGLVFLVGLLCSGSCGQISTPGELMLLVSTDLAVPTDVDTLRVTVTHSGGGKALVDDSYPLRGEAAAAPADPTRYLPGTFALVSSDTLRGVVAVHLELRQGGENGVVRVQRDAELEIPSAGVKQLPMPLNFLCSYLAQACAAGTTCQAGQCVDAKVDSSALDDYVPAVPSKCFDVPTCLLTGAKITDANSVLPERDSAMRCSYRGGMTLGSVDINVALIVNTPAVGNQGVCDETVGKCLVPLEKGPEGWQTLYDSSDPMQAVGIALPDAVCDQGLGVAIFKSSSVCATKTAAAGLCPAPGACIEASGFCPADWYGLSCSGSLNPFCPNPPCPEEELCGQVVTDPMLGPTVAGLWCCTQGQPAQPDHPLLIDDMSSGSMIKIPATSNDIPGDWFTASDDTNATFFPPVKQPFMLFPYRAIEPPATPSGGPTISHAACLRADHGFKGDYALEGFTFYLDRADYTAAAFDVSPYTGIRFWAKAQIDPLYNRVTTVLRVGFPNADTDGGADAHSTCKNTPFSGGNPCNDDFITGEMLTSDWTLYTVKWAELTQEGYGAPFPFFNKNVYTTYFMVTDGTRPFDFCIAQIEFTTD